MAKAGPQSITWIPIRDAYPAILEKNVTPELCQDWFVANVADGLRYRAKSSTAEDDKKFWQSGTPRTASWPTVDFDECKATRIAVIDGAIVSETLMGIEVVREDLEKRGLTFRDGGRKLGTKEGRISELARLRWPQTDGRPPESVNSSQVCRLIAADYERAYPGEPAPARTTILRNPTIGRLSRP